MSDDPSRGSGPDGPSEQPRPPRRRSPSRSVRLRRTIAVVLGLALLVVAGIALVLSWGDGDQPVQASSALPSTGATGHPSAGASGRPSASTSGREEHSTSARPSTAASTKASAPAPSPAKPSDVPARGTGAVHLVRVPGPPSTAHGRTVRYTVAVEGGIPVSGKEFARTVHDILLDPRGWQTEDHVRFVAVTPRQVRHGAHVDIQVSLASPDTTDRMCAPFNTAGKVSCTTTSGTVVLNLRRWMLGAPTWGDDLLGYRRYLVNHEVGHGLGHHHVHCPAKGKRAPVMLQQTLRLEGCTPWSWPTGAKDGAPAPG